MHPRVLRPEGRRAVGRRVALGPPRRWHGPLVVAVTLALAVLALLNVSAGPAAAQPAGCVPDAETACITGTIRTEAGEGAAGIVITVTGGPEELTATTGDDGRWAVAITEAGEYVVELDTATLPAGETLRDPGANPRTVTANLGSTVAAAFPLGPPTGGGEPTEAATDEGEDDQTTAPPAGSGDEGGVTESAETAASGGDLGTRVLQLTLSGLVFGLLLALASVGLSLIYGTTGLSNFSHGELVTLGGIVAYIAAQWWGLSLFLAGLVAVVVGAIMGYAQNAVLWAPLRRRGVGITQQMIVTIGLAVALQYALHLIVGGNPLRISTANPPIIDLGPVRITQTSAISVGIAVVVLAAMAYVLLATRVGRATRAVSDNPALASASGIDVESIVRGVWVTGAALAALGGTLLGLYLNATRWNTGTTLLLLMFAAVTLGGLGAAMGALVGSIAIGLVVELSTLVLPSDMRYASALVILILVLLFRPQGILGRAERVG
ncbi:inner-membrane translocator [Beutenbergia cavernae DSM 12333]|uniref:Inner-membrane translocator n=1 Tax=Beutenbergia cavernae (strain ATCC BAA-8 / DSM 12333 / CCUG 43141 / JCM 11478 / NBRC 16432 / NCIMB 13614 / HKI 0122) TaxID=471853 RepID=C5BV67_BEUC1|nr:branched-chain amino acid ABC transporter permease [Beutenbergia cavernae]ACQ80454.1 inner-membrane translocator [Beutenbergia cavernae DSM 12333]